MTCGDHGDHKTSESDEIHRKWKLVRTLDCLLDFFSQLILTTRSRGSPAMYWWPVVTKVTMGPVCIMILTMKQKLIITLNVLQITLVLIFFKFNQFNNEMYCLLFLFVYLIVWLNEHEIKICINSERCSLSLQLTASFHKVKYSLVGFYLVKNEVWHVKYAVSVSFLYYFYILNLKCQTMSW